MSSAANLPLAVFIGGILLFIVGAAAYFSPTTPATDQLPTKSSLTERDIAISKALRDGQSEYSFTTNFIPGIGFINDPEVYLKQWEEEAKQGFETE